MPQRNRLTFRFVNDSFQEILRRLDAMDSFRQKTETFQQNTESFQQKMETFQLETNAKFERLQSDVSQVKETVHRMSVLVARIPEIEKRLAALENRMERLEGRIRNLEGLYLHHDKRLEILDHEYVSITAALKRLEERFDKLEADNLQHRVRVLEGKVAELEKNSLN